MQPIEPVDLAVAEVAREVTASWPPARARAAMAVLGLGPRQPSATLAEAAAAAQVSRESVRRDRDRLVADLAKDGRVAHVADVLAGFVREHGGRLEVIEAQSSAVTAGLVRADGALLPLWATLAAGHLLPEPLPGRFGDELLAPDGDQMPASRALSLLSDGLPHDVTAALGTDAAARVLPHLLRSGVVWVLRRPSGVWMARTDLVDNPAGRELRRLVTMTGPLPWADLLAAWGRAKGRAPYGSLPADVTVVEAWVDALPGVQIRASEVLGGPQVVEATGRPVELGKVDQFLLESLSEVPAGLARQDLLALAERAGLAASSASTVLTYHPALINPGRGLWALRPSPERSRHFRRPVAVSPTQRRAPRRPTTYSWTAAGELVLQISMPATPSPVVSIPAPIAEVVEGRELAITAPSVAGVMIVRGAKAWGFAAALSAIGARPGDRVDLICDLVMGTVTFQQRRISRGQATT
ncbi:hypothetical protein CELL_01608 [Cellulomonas sp. T2.31MG-18]|uniref:hypothetical protein n=1 Tax=Cellulomonas sp. T2.31MG-18 TaxID=3157619 RepID=UPI0035E6BFFC